MRTLLLLSATLIALVGSAPTAAAQASRGQHLGDTATDSAQTRHATQTAAEDAQRASQTCYTMRSYIFARQDGSAPRLVGMTTCTPAGRFRTYHASQRAKPGLYPAMIAPVQDPPATEPQQSRSGR